MIVAFLCYTCTQNTERGCEGKHETKLDFAEGRLVQTKNPFPLQNQRWYMHTPKQINRVQADKMRLLQCTIRELKHRPSWATDSNRKLIFFSLEHFDTTTFVTSSHRRPTRAFPSIVRSKNAPINKQTTFSCRQCLTNVCA